MSDEGFSYAMGIEDHMSGPADHIRAALGSLQKQLVEVQEAKLSAAMKGNAVSMRAAGLEAQRLGLESGKLASELREVEKVQKEAEKAKGETFFGQLKGSLIPEVAVGELVAEAFKKIGEAAVEAATKMAELVIETTKFAVESAEFKENAIAAYTAVRGTAEEGEETFKQIDKLAGVIHAPAEKAHGLAQALLVEGLENQEQLTSAIAAVTALQRVGLEAGAAKIQRVIETSLASGHFELNKRLLRGTGLQVEEVYGDIAKRLHLSVDQVKKQMKEGKIAAEVGIASITDAINNGKVGQIAAKKFDITDAVTDFKNSIKQIFQDVDVGPLKQALVDFVSLFSQGSASGQEMHDVVTKAFTGIISWVSQAIEAITLFALDVAIAGVDMYIGLFPAIDALVRLKNEMFGDTESLKRFEEAFGALLDQVVGVANAIGKLVQAYQSLKAIAATGHVVQFASPGQEHLTDEGGAKHAAADAATPAGLGGGAARVPGGVEGPGAKVTEAPHAAGGVVHEPPPGEAFAAVKPGEMILPANFTMPSVDFGKGRGEHREISVSIDMGGIHMGAVHNAEDFMAIVESSLTDVAERFALELGG